MRPIALVLAALAATSSLGVAQTRVEIKPIPRDERPLIAIRDLSFAAAFSPDDRKELNGWDGLSMILSRNKGHVTTRSSSEDLLAKQLTNLIMDALQASGNFRLLERDKLSAIISEEDLGTSGRAAVAQATAQTGELLTAKYVVTGAITKFGKSTKKKGGIGGAIGGAIRSGIGVGVESSSTDYEIGISIRVADASTGEVFTSIETEASARGNVSRKIGGFGIVGAAIGGAMSSSASGEREKKIAEAMKDVAEMAAIKLVEKREMGDLPVR